MANNSVVITIETDRSVNECERALQIGNEKDKEGLVAVASFINHIRASQSKAKIDVQVGTAAPVAASGTLTLVSVIATDTVTVGDVTFTFTSTPTLETDVEVDGASNALDAAALAAAINAHSTISKIVKAVAESNVVTVTCKTKGVIGNVIPIASGDATITASGSFLENGTGGAQDDASIYVIGL